MNSFAVAIAVAVATGAAHAQIPVVDRPPGIVVVDLAEAAKLPVAPPELSEYLKLSPEEAERFRQLQAAEYDRNKAEALRRARAYRSPTARATSAAASAPLKTPMQRE